MSKFSYQLWIFQFAENIHYAPSLTNMWNIQLHLHFPISTSQISTQATGLQTTATKLVWCPAQPSFFYTTSGKQDVLMKI